MSIHFHAFLQSQRSFGKWAGWTYASLATPRHACLDLLSDLSNNAVLSLYLKENCWTIYNESRAHQTISSINWFATVNAKRRWRPTVMFFSVGEKRISASMKKQPTRKHLDSMKTFVDKLRTLISIVMEDTLLTIKIYEHARWVLLFFRCALFIDMDSGSNLMHIDLTTIFFSLEIRPKNRHRPSLLPTTTFTDSTTISNNATREQKMIWSSKWNY